MTDRLRVLIASNYTGRGGIPHFVAWLANGLAERGHQVTIISQKPIPKFLHPLYMLGHRINAMSLPPSKRAPFPLASDRLEDIYKLKASIEIVPFSLSDNNLRIQALRKKIAAMDLDACVIPAADGSQLVWAVTLMGTGIPYVCSERTSPQTMEQIFWSRKGRLAAMSGADAIHLLLPSYAESVPSFLKDKVNVIPNAVHIPEQAANPTGGKRKAFLWLGRLYEEAKQCRLAIDSFVSVAELFPDWDFIMAGDGPDRKMVSSHAVKTGIETRIKLIGESPEPESLMLGAQAFCFSSRIEGMPNVLLEAMAAGLPCVAFSGCPGVSDIVRDGDTGLLAGEMTADCLGSRMAELMGSAALRESMGMNARRAMGIYDSAGLLDAWENLLARSALNKGHTVMDSFRDEPFASMARLSSRARQEWALRDFGQPMPDSVERKIKALPTIIKKSIRKAATRLVAKVI